MNKERLIWLGGELIPVSEAKINVLSPTSQFGANVFEGIRCYWNNDMDQLYAFRLEDHFNRLLDSIKIFKMDANYTVEYLISVLKEVIIANNYKEDIAVRQTVFIDGLGGTWNSKGPVNMFVAPIAKSRKIYKEQNGLRCCISSWERINDNNLSPRAKVGANYINSRMAHLEATDNGYDTAIFLNKFGKVAEAPGSCIFIIRNGELITPPCTASVLESITRDTIMKIARNDLNISVIERDIDRTELYICDAAFLCGSAMEITPICSFDSYKINNSVNNNLVHKLFEEYDSVISGTNNKYLNWLTPIY
ncbi:branched-chain amino acid transaminase [Marinilabiliaceae bacterium JC040]|nr:branched-chain amino acid transaminase [Marinilabiliaceae bacterium JC040]